MALATSALGKQILAVVFCILLSLYISAFPLPYDFSFLMEVIDF